MRLRALPIFGIEWGMASKNTSISLGKPFTDFAARKVESGEFATTSEVVREAMRQYMAEDDRIVALRAIIQKSLDSGPAREFDIDAWFEEKFGAE
jgi:antitoxin ParD1/3/4